MAWSSGKTILPHKREGVLKIKRVATARKPPVVVPIVVVPIDVHVTLVVPAVEGGLCGVPSVPPPVEYSLGWILFCIAMHQHSTPSIFFFEVSTYITLPKTVILDILDVWILISATSIREHLLIYLLSHHSIQTKRALHEVAPRGPRSKVQGEPSGQVPSTYLRQPANHQ